VLSDSECPTAVFFVISEDMVMAPAMWFHPGKSGNDIFITPVLVLVCEYFAARRSVFIFKEIIR
jgi:hypothetical protein